MSEQLHETPVDSVTVIPENDTYITVSRDGVACAWTRTMMKHCNTMRTGTKAEKKKDVGGGGGRSDGSGGGSIATNMVYMKSLRKLVVANTNYTMSFYDSSTFKKDKELPLASLPLCLTAWTEKDQDFLAYGDEHGKVHIYSQKKVELQLHKDWVTKIEYNTDLNALVSSSSDGTVKITEVLNRCTTKMTLKGHPKGVTSFAWCSYMDVLATCGLERQINVYNPGYQIPIFKLYGHTAQVLDVVSAGQSQFISLDAEQVIHAIITPFKRHLIPILTLIHAKDKLTAVLTLF